MFFKTFIHRFDVDVPTYPMQVDIGIPRYFSNHVKAAYITVLLERGMGELLLIIEGVRIGFEMKAHSVPKYRECARE